MDQFKSEEQLSHIDGIGGASVSDALNKPTTFAQNAVELFTPWITDTDKNSERGTLAVDVWQPSSVLKDTAGNQYIFRVSANESAHTPPQADVSAQVKDDWKTWTVYQKKLDAAKQFLADVQSHGMAAAASLANLGTPIMTSPFNPARLTPDTTISPLNLKPDSVMRLSKAAEKLLSDPVPASGRPSEAVELYADRMIAVIELFTATPIMGGNEQFVMLALVSDEKAQQDQQSLVAAYVDYDAVAQRVHFVKSGS
jgi:hypothetical protein